MDAETRKAIFGALEYAMGTLNGPPGAREDAVQVAKYLVPELEQAGYTITRIDHEAQAVAELMALERAGKIEFQKDWPGSQAWRVFLPGVFHAVCADTPNELLTAVVTAPGVEV